MENSKKTTVIMTCYQRFKNLEKLLQAWLEKYWTNWKPGEDYENFKIVPTTNIPEEILGRYTKSINLLY